MPYGPQIIVFILKFPFGESKKFYLSTKKDEKQLIYLILSNLI